MKKLILKTLTFASSLILLFGLLLLLPPTPRASKSLLFASIKKDSLLANTPEPRIIFVGGSNLSFGLNSNKIKDSLNINPINTAIHASIGMRYILKSALQYIRPGDIIVLVPEYSHFYKDWNYSTEYLFRIVFDCNKKNIKLLSLKQMYDCFQYTGKFIFSKFDKNEYFNVEESTVYSVNSFNKYGDADAHWNLLGYACSPYDGIDVTKYNPKVMLEIKHFADKLREKGCVLLVSYPCLQESSFNNSIEAIKKVEKEYHANGFTVLGSPERYMMHDSLIYDTPYHLIKQGVELRTNLLIEDLKAVLPCQRLCGGRELTNAWAGSTAH